VTSEGRFYSLRDAGLAPEPYEGRLPQVWIGANGPRMLDITGRHADGWWPAGAFTPEDYAAKLAAIHRSAEKADRDPAAIVAAITQICLIGDDDEIATMLEAPLVKAIIL